MLRFLSNTLILAWFSLLTGAAIEMYRSPDWALRPVAIASGDAPQNLTERIEQALFKRTPVTITDAEINRHLANNLVSKNANGWQPQFESGSVALHPGGFETRLLWRIQNGHPITATLDFTFERKGNTFVIEPVHGSFGRLKLPRGFLSPILPTLDGIAKAFKSEIDLAFQMNHIRFEEGRILMDPRLEPAK